MRYNSVGYEFIVVEGKFGGQGRERKVVQAGRGAVLATSAVGMLVICNVHDGDGRVFVIGEGIVNAVI
jgi:hypothetical protein